MILCDVIADRNPKLGNAFNNQKIRMGWKLLQNSDWRFAEVFLLCGAFLLLGVLICATDYDRLNETVLHYHVKPIRASLSAKFRGVQKFGDVQGEYVIVCSAVAAQLWVPPKCLQEPP